MWIYLSEQRAGRKAEGARRLAQEYAVKGPMSLAALVRLIRSGRLSVLVIVAPTPQFRENGVPACLWPQVLRALSANVTILGRTWIRGARRNWPEREFWASVIAEQVVEKLPARGWRLLCALVKAADRETLAYVGAGLLEDVIQLHRTYHARIVARAQRDSRFRLCLGHVRAMFLTKRMRGLAAGVP